LKPWHFFRGPSQGLERFKRWSVYAPAIPVCPQPRLLSHRGDAPVLSSRPPHDQEGRQASRAPLPNIGVTFAGEMLATSSEGVTPPSSLLRAHVPLPLGSPLLRHLTSFEESLQVVLSPCCPWELPDVISESLSLDAGSLTPAAHRARSPVSSTVSSAFPRKPWVGCRICPANDDFSQGSFRGRR
jgi:hypothetical protein